MSKLFTKEKKSELDEPAEPAKKDTRAMRFDPWFRCDTTLHRLQPVGTNEIPEPQSTDWNILELVAVVEHQGKQLSNGHFVAYVKDHSVWFRCDGEEISQCTSEKAVLDAEAYLLLYRKRSGHDDEDEDSALSNPPSRQSKDERTRLRDAIACLLAEDTRTGETDSDMESAHGSAAEHRAYDGVIRV